jgi:hypothetical protein
MVVLVVLHVLHRVAVVELVRRLDIGQPLVAEVADHGLEHVRLRHMRIRISSADVRGRAAVMLPAFAWELSPRVR